MELLNRQSSSLVYIFAGLILWQFISNSIVQSSVYLHGKRYVMLVSNQRSLFLAASLVIQNFITLLSQFPVLLIVLARSESPLELSNFILASLCIFFFTPFMMFVVYLIGFLSVLRDNLTQYLAPLMQALFILSPIFWDQSLLEDQVRWTYALNVLYFPVWIFHAVLLGEAVPVPQFASLLVLPILLYLSLFRFSRKIEQKIQMGGSL